MDDAIQGDEKMNLPPLPKPVFYDGRQLYTTAQMRQYAKDAIDAQPKTYTPQAKYGSKVPGDVAALFGGLNNGKRW